MNIEENLNNFPFLNEKYIILYNDIYNKAEYLNEKYNCIVVIFLLKNISKKYNKDKKSNSILEIYIDDYVEELLIKYSYCIIDLNEYVISNNIINYLNKYNKLIITDINDLEKFENNKSQNIEILENTINSSIYNYTKMYNEMYNEICNNKNNINNYDKNVDKKNVKPNYENIQLHNKKINYIEYDVFKINIMVYYLKNELEIINIIQKKCIYENIKNKYVDKIYIFGNNIKNYILESINNTCYSEKIIFCETDRYLSFNDFKDYANKFLKDKIICILRGDIILLNNNELEDLDTELNIYNKNIYTLSRYDRLLNGNIVKYDKLNKILFSTEHDSWIFKSPLEIDENYDIILEKLNINDKYSELYFNDVLKKNNYTLINNNNKYKVIRLLCENNLENRPLLTNNINKNILIENMEYLNLVPDSSINNVSVDSMLKVFNIDDDEIYLIKCYLFNKYFKKKIINDLIY